MTLDTDDEILQDFLVEAEEILEGLNEQLVELENSLAMRICSTPSFAVFTPSRGAPAS